MSARASTVRPMREPKGPKIPQVLTPAGRADAELADDGEYRSLEYGPLAMTGFEVEDVEFERCRFNETGFAGVTLRRAGFTDVAFKGCDLANLQLVNSRMFNSTVTNCRMTGTHLSEGGLRDVVFQACRADLAGFRFASLRDVVFRDCNLSEASFQNAELRNVRFENCKLMATQFSNADMNSTRFSDCDLAGVAGIESFNGAIVSNADAQSLLYALTSALGITIED
jgi:uncharacterized protein YjbI with pentapeptide repeats